MVVSAAVRIRRRGAGSVGAALAVSTVVTSFSLPGSTCEFAESPLGCILMRRGAALGRAAPHATRLMLGRGLRTVQGDAKSAPAFSNDRAQPPRALRHQPSPE